MFFIMFSPELFGYLGPRWPLILAWSSIRFSVRWIFDPSAPETDHPNMPDFRQVSVFHLCNHTRSDSVSPHHRRCHACAWSFPISCACQTPQSRNHACAKHTFKVQIYRPRKTLSPHHSFVDRPLSMHLSLTRVGPSMLWWQRDSFCSIFRGNL